MRPPARTSARIVFFLSLLATFVYSQERETDHPPDYPGVRIHIPGVFVTPVAGAPFSGTVEILSKQLLPNGSMYTRRTINQIARNSLGVIHNETRKLVPLQFKGEPPILSTHIYDPQTRLSTYLITGTHIARQSVLARKLVAPANSTPETSKPPANATNFKTEDLGTHDYAGLVLHGTRKSRTIPAQFSGTGKDVIIVDDYWYSEELKVYLVVDHKDPRTGEQMVGIVQADRKEPDPALFQIPPTYKIVDETLASSK